MRCSCWEWLLLEQVVLQCMRWESHTWMKMSKIRWRQCTLAYLWQVGFLVSYHHTGNWWYTSFLQRRNWNNHFSIIGYSFFFSGAAVGFVLISRFLVMFVEPGVQTSLTIQDKRWVGNWWIGFAIFGAICVFWSIWLLGFPKEFPLTKKRRELEVSATNTVISTVGEF